MKKRFVLCILLAIWMLLGTLVGCAPSFGGEQNAEQYIDPVYPPHYEVVYQELFGADIDTVVEKLGYTREDFALVEDIIPFYRTGKTVTYLDQEYQLELWFNDGEAATALSSVALYKELPGTPEEQAKLAVEQGELLKKMFGQHPEKRDAELEKRYVLNEALFKDWFTGTEDVNRTIDFFLAEEVEHIPEKGMPLTVQANPEFNERLDVDIQLKYWVCCYPSLDVPPALRISFGTDVEHATVFVRN